MQLTLVDDAGKPIEGVFNNTVRLIDYDPDLDDGLAKIVRGDITLAEIGGIVDPDYEPDVPEPEASEPPIENSDDSGEAETDQQADPAAPEVPQSEVLQSEQPKSEVTQTTPLDETSKSLDDGVLDAESEESAVNAELPVESPSVSEPSVLEGSKPDSLEAPAVLEKAEREADLMDNQLEEVVQASEDKDAETVPDITGSDSSLDADSSVESEFVESKSTSEPIDDDPVIAEPTMATPAETLADPTTDDPTDVDDVAPSKRRYLQRLYDYRDRSMQTYER